MPVKFIETSLSGLFIIEPERFRDSRGFFMEIYHQKKYEETGMTGDFVQDNHSHSKRGVLRGLHYQLRHPQDKLIHVITGEIFDVAVDIRRGSPTFGKWLGTYLSMDNKRQVLLPKGFAHGFCVLSEKADVIYKCTNFYASEDEYGVLWSDPVIAIEWPVQTPLLSEKDRQNPRLDEIPEADLPVYKT